MIEAAVKRWAAWSPDLEDEAAWRRWCDAPTPLGCEGRPEAGFLPKMLRRRCGTLSRIVLKTAFDCCAGDELSVVASVFASRHGNINESIELLERLAERRPLSPTAFSHTVHNAQAGLFSIAAGNRQASTSIAAQQGVFACGYLEALALLQRDPERPVLLVIADIPLAPTFAALVDETPAAYGLALLLSTHCEAGDIRLGFAPGARPGFDPGASDAAPASPAWPHAIEFLRFLLSGEPRLALGSGRRQWVWERLH